jgi:hypothetical protein
MKMSNIKKETVLLISTLILLFELPFILAVRPIAAGEPSWIFALYRAGQEHLQWGKDIIYTFGPLYYITLGNYSILNFSENFMITLARSFLVFGSWLVIIDSLWRSSTKSWKSNKIYFFLICTVILMILPNFWMSSATLDLLMAAAIFGISSILAVQENDRMTNYILVFSALLLAILTLVKVSYLALSVLICVIGSFGFLLRRNFPKALLLVASFLLFLTLLWTGSGQRLVNLGAYILNSGQTVSGYTEAMQVQSTKYQSGGGAGLDFIANFVNLGSLDTIFIYVIFVTLFIFSLFVLLILGYHKRKWWIIYLLLLALPFVMVAFKEGVVRAGVSHFYLSLYAFLFLTLFLMFVTQVFELGRPVVYSLSLVMIVVYFLLVPVDFSYLSDALRLSHQPAERNTQGSYYFSNVYFFETPAVQDLNSREKMQVYYKFDNQGFYKNINQDQTIDILPQETSLAYAYGLNLDSLPAFQLYSAYTKDLDLLNAEKMRNDPPRQIIYSLSTIDDRYPLFDGPTVMREMFLNYKIKSADANNYLLLVREAHPTEYRVVEIEHTWAGLGDIIEIPQLESSYVYSSIDLKMTFLGKIINVLYKIPPLQIQLYVEGEADPKQFRFLRDLAQNGLFVSKYVANQQDLIKVFNRDNLSDISSMRILPVDDSLFDSYLSRISYANEFRVTFFSLEPKEE